MAGGGSTEAMKVSDIFILVGISILVAGLVMHGWVDPDEYIAEGNETAEVSKSMQLMKNDRIEIEVNYDSGPVEVLIYYDDSFSSLSPYDLDGKDGEMKTARYKFDADSAGDYFVSVQISDDTGTNETKIKGEVIIDVQRSTMLDFITYPIGALMLAFGLYKRKEDKSNEVLDAELD